MVKTTYLRRDIECLVEACNTWSCFSSVLMWPWWNSLIKSEVSIRRHKWQFSFPRNDIAEEVTSRVSHLLSAHSVRKSVRQTVPSLRPCPQSHFPIPLELSLTLPAHLRVTRSLVSAIIEDSHPDIVSYKAVGKVSPFIWVVHDTVSASRKSELRYRPWHDLLMEKHSQQCQMPCKWL